MTQPFAQPYDIVAGGFYFESVTEFDDKARKAINDYGQPVEEFEIQFIDGEGIDCALFNALGINQCLLSIYFDAVEEWSQDDQIKVIIAVGEAGYRFDLKSGSPSDLDVDLYECDTMRDFAFQFVDDGLLGEIPASLQHYLD